MAALANGLSQLPAQLAVAPHRLMFFAGAVAVLTSMLWWACFLVAGYTGHAFPAPPVPAGWAHALLIQYGMLPLFIFGFLLTVFPRWMSQPALSKIYYIPVFIGMFGGYVLAHFGLLNLKPLFIVGLVMMLSGWTFALATLARLVWRNEFKDRHALSCGIALMVGAFGLAAFVAFVLGAPWEFAVVSMKLGTFGCLLPLYFTVCHRMIPFFSASVVPGYVAIKPAWSLPICWGLLMLHIYLELVHRFEWLWLVDVPLTAFFLWHWLAWQPWKCLRPGLLAALYLSFAWLPIAFGLFAIQSLVLRLDGTFVLGRGPVHALTIGFFGSMLVSMVTRVTQGHSGRPLQMGAVPWLTFALLQVVAMIRIGAELAPNTRAWLIVAGIGWLIAFLPWVLRSSWIYLSPRLDGKPG